MIRTGSSLVQAARAYLTAGATKVHAIASHLVLPGDNTPFVPWIDLQSDATLALTAAHNKHTFAEEDH